MTTYEQERIGDFIQTYTGGKFYILDPKKEDVRIEDIAHALSNLCRFTGHSGRFYCVGEHSLLCAKVARKLKWTPLQQLILLLHDASETYCADLNRPLKQNLTEYKKIEDKIMETIWNAFNIPQPTKDDYELVKLIDNTILKYEFRDVMGRDEFPHKLKTIDVDIDLTYGYGAGESKYDFLVTFRDLMDEISGYY